MAEQKRAKLSDRAKAKLAELRARYPWLDHVIAMVEHYGKVQGNVLAGAVTYFGFLSFFPILALAFSVVGYVSIAFPDARDSLVEAIQQIFPGIVTVDGSGNTISLQQIENAKTTAGILGLLVLLYAGLGWLSGLRAALSASFELPQEERHSFVVGKALDLLVLVAIGVVMIVSVGVAGVARGLANDILEFVGLEDTWIGPALVQSLGIILGFISGTILFFLMYRILGKPDLPARPLWQGAMLGAAGFEILKLIVVSILGGVGGSAFAPLAIAVTLMIWINYFSRLVFYGASWAMTSPMSKDALAERESETEPAESAESTA